MTDRFKPLLDRTFLKAEFTYEYEDFKAGPLEAALLARLQGWAARSIHGETQIEAAFIARIFEDTWGYRPDGSGAAGFTLRQQFPVPGAGAGGAAGSAISLSAISARAGRKSRKCCASSRASAPVSIGRSNARAAPVRRRSRRSTI